MPYNQKYTKENLSIVVADSRNIAHVLNKLGLFQSGGNHCHISKLIKQFEIDTSHFSRVSSSGFIIGKQPWTYHLVKSEKNRRKNATQLRRCLIEYGIEYKCVECGIDDNWNGKKLILQVDHINHNKTDNRPDNLRFLCPNCHTQTVNYAGKKTKTKTKVKFKVKSSYKTPDKIKWPSKSELLTLVWSKPTTILAKELGVSDKAIDRKCKLLGIKKPERGYWMKLRAKSLDK